MNIEKLALSILQQSENGQVSEKDLIDISDNNGLTLSEFSKLCDIVSETGITIVTSKIGTMNKQKETTEKIISMFSQLPFGDKRSLFIKLGSILDYSQINVEERQKELLLENITSFADFCISLANCDYNVTLDKKMLIDEGKMTPAYYKKLQDELTIFGHLLKDYKSCVLLNAVKSNDQLNKLTKKKKNDAFEQLKIIKQMFCVHQKCGKLDIDILAEQCVSKKYQGVLSPKLMFKLSVCNNISILNHIMKLLNENAKVKK